MKENRESQKDFFDKMTLFEREAYSKGFSYVVGVDEVGRGPLAGPVVAAACHVPKGKCFLGINDSKKLSPYKRSRLCEALKSDSEVIYHYGVVSVEVIDKINILNATKQAMLEAVSLFSQKVDFILVDGLDLKIFSTDSRSIIKGDSLSQSIAAASILAKEFRDALMRKYHEEFPQYGFDRHKGYGTVLHLQALKKFGPCKIHRKSFSPVAALL